MDAFFEKYNLTWRSLGALLLSALLVSLVTDNYGELFQHNYAALELLLLVAPGFLLVGGVSYFIAVPGELTLGLLFVGNLAYHYFVFQYALSRR